MVRFRESPPECHFVFQVLNVEENAFVPLSQEGANLARRDQSDFYYFVRELEPGDQITESVDLTRLYGRLAAGTYRVSAYRKFELPMLNTRSTRVLSNVIFMKITK